MFNDYPLGDFVYRHLPFILLCLFLTLFLSGRSLFLLSNSPPIDADLADIAKWADESKVYVYSMLSFSVPVIMFIVLILRYLRERRVSRRGWEKDETF